MELNNEEIVELIDIVHNRYGYDFKNYSRASVKRRITRFLYIKNITSLFTFKHQLLNDESFFIDFLQNITVNVTEMFRDPAFYISLREKIIPQLASYPHIKIWHAGCSTGEEVYSMAILLKEAGLLERSKLYATDISASALNKAKQGIFSLKNMKEYTLNYRNAGGKANLSDYYTANHDFAVFDESLKKNTIFALHNLVSDQSFNEFNLILCRNVLIYFDKELQNSVFHLFTNSLCAFGYLALGTKESLMFTDSRKSYAVIDSHMKIFKKIH